MTYTSLPPNYSGNSYYYNNRHYAGGRYETGRYSYGGRTYASRYYHNGGYLYGGDYRQNPGPGSYQRGPVRTTSVQARPTGGGGHVTYTTLPPNYSGTTYFYNNRYYSGGKYESGRYAHAGRTYGNRYYHNGQYYYGGVQRQHTGSDVYSDRNRRSATRRTSVRAAY